MRFGVTSSKLAQATGLGVFTYSRAGYGRPDSLVDLPRVLNYMTREAEDNLGLILNEMGITSAILIGHSDGASIAAVYAGTMKDGRIKGAVLMAPHFFTEPMGLKEIAMAKEVYETQDLKAKMAKYHKDPENFRGWNDSWLHPEFEAWNIEPVLDEMPVPIMAIQGEDDQYGTRAQIDVISKCSPVHVTPLMLDDRRHAPFIDQPDLVLDVITSFSKDLIGI